MDDTKLGKDSIGERITIEDSDPSRFQEPKSNTEPNHVSVSHDRRLFNYFLVVGLPPQKHKSYKANIRCEPEILFQYPSDPPHSNFPKLEQLKQFCFPSGLT